MSTVLRILDSWPTALALALLLHLGVAWFARGPAPPPAPVAFTITLLGTGQVPPAAPPEGALDPATTSVDVPRSPPDPQQPALPDRSAERRRLVEDAARTERIQAALARARRDVGTPDGAWGGGQAALDPELARWSARVEQQFRDAFHPLPALVRAHPDLRAVYRVDFDPDTGAVLGGSPIASSGQPAFDGAAERALRAVEAIPPPPERSRDRVGTALIICFEPP